MLGFLHLRESYELCFTPTFSFRPRVDDLHLRLGDRHALDARHGRVLLSWAPFISGYLRSRTDLTVWDPISGDQLDLPELLPPQHQHYPYLFGSNSRAVVLCASTACDHLDCRRGHFLVVFIDASSHEVYVYIYSSEAGAWSHPTSAALDLNDPVRLLHRWHVAMAGNALYFSVHRRMTTGILRYDLGTQEISWVDLPPDCRCQDHRILLTTTGYGGLGIARVDNSRIRLWSREAGPNGVLGWAPSGAIELETVLPANSGDISTVAFVEGIGAFFIRTNVGSFTVDLVSNQVRKVFGNSHGVSSFVPYTSFLTPALGAAFTGAGSTAGGPTA
ncbi:hypothetical protein SORBI_3002G096600 [Sorghum bicolor]|uniref:F-box protein AT5G49610-like beta-propeller domain-containing protein n=1 Tax=Sorghum bicolor TaxID=4558 RepID=A0A1W0W362_SORBI|nr:hypothetical protein SORBI_3002G096600 [Sorghum bicolor]